MPLQVPSHEHIANPLDSSDICKIIFAILLPPVGVFLEVGCNADLLINILLTILGVSSCSFFLETHLARPFLGLADFSFFSGEAVGGRARLTAWRVCLRAQYIPGIIHALYIILKY